MKINFGKSTPWCLFSIVMVVFFSSCARPSQQLIAHHVVTAEKLTERVESLIQENALLVQDNEKKKLEITRLQDNLAKIEEPNAGWNGSENNTSESKSSRDRANPQSQTSRLLASGNPKLTRYIQDGIEFPLSVSLKQMEEVIAIARSYIGTPPQKRRNLSFWDRLLWSRRDVIQGHRHPYIATHSIGNWPIWKRHCECR